MNLAVPASYLEDLFNVLEKTAEAADAADLQTRKLTAENEELRRRPAAKRAFFSPQLLNKATQHLEQEGLLPAGVNAKQASELISEDPDRLVNLVVGLTPTVTSDGRPVKAASPQPLSGAVKLVRVGDKDLVDADGWDVALTQK